APCTSCTSRGNHGFPICPSNHGTWKNFSTGPATAPPQQLHQHQERPILMMPTPGLPQSAPIPHRPKERIFRPPTTVLNMPTPPVPNPNAISVETMTAAYGRMASRLLKHASNQDTNPPTE
ncbi:hypothetical protein PIB30_083540, partial [Stylosanthes scabra]|nr:hypothetical protein [Stylosanthes scabra]